MSERGACSAQNEKGEPCKQVVRKGTELCFWHDPEQADAAKEARRLGGVRSKREATIGEAFGLVDLATVEGSRRLLEIAAHDALELPNTMHRVRGLTGIALAAVRLLEANELAEQVAEIQHVLSLRPEEQKWGRR